jgi:hypothetical protein
LAYSAKDKADRAKAFLADPFVQELLHDLEQRAIDEFVNAHRWWWGDRKRRLAAERLQVVKNFRHRIEMAIVTGPEARIGVRRNG